MNTFLENLDGKFDTWWLHFQKKSGFDGSDFSGHLNKSTIGMEILFVFRTISFIAA